MRVKKYKRVKKSRIGAADEKDVLQEAEAAREANAVLSDEEADSTAPTDTSKLSLQGSEYNSQLILSDDDADVNCTAEEQSVALSELQSDNEEAEAVAAAEAAAAAAVAAQDAELQRSLADVQKSDAWALADDQTEDPTVDAAAVDDVSATIQQPAVVSRGSGSLWFKVERVFSFLQMLWLLLQVPVDPWPATFVHAWSWCAVCTEFMRRCVCVLTYKRLVKYFVADAQPYSCC
jgi:hypothetical protein